MDKCSPLTVNRLPFIESNLSHVQISSSSTTPLSSPLISPILSSSSSTTSSSSESNTSNSMDIHSTLPVDFPIFLHPLPQVQQLFESLTPLSTDEIGLIRDYYGGHAAFIRIAPAIFFTHQKQCEHVEQDNINSNINDIRHHDEKENTSIHAHIKLDCGMNVIAYRYSTFMYSRIIIYIVP